MTDFVAAEECESINRPAVFETYRARETALGSMEITRALPVRGRRMIGPWCFLDRYGPRSFLDEKPMDVAPHPHIGLQTVSWLLEGEVLHLDSLGSEAVVRPGGVNVMTSGKGIAHSEETPARNVGRLSGVQLWVALPDVHRHVEPSFQAVANVPILEFAGFRIQVFMGEFEGETPAAASFSDLVGLDAAIHRGETAIIPVRPQREHGVMLLEGEASFQDHPLEARAIHYLGCGRPELEFRSTVGARILLLGGIPFPEQVLMWWNFVARTPEEIADARAAWQDGRLGEVRAYDGPRIEAPPLAKLAPPNPAS